VNDGVLIFRQVVRLTGPENIDLPHMAISIMLPSAKEQADVPGAVDLLQMEDFISDVFRRVFHSWVG